MGGKSVNFAPTGGKALCTVCILTGMNTNGCLATYLP